MALQHNEVRTDHLLSRRVVIAANRGLRPTDFVDSKRVPREETQAVNCPLCPGNEHLTPPAVLVYLKSGENIIKTTDKDKSRHRNWLVRCVPNLYPAFTPPERDTTKLPRQRQRRTAAAVGHHEVLIESPNHDEHPADCRIAQLNLVVRAYIDRLRQLSLVPYVRYVSVFRNHRLEAGASLSHAHSQIITTPFVPEFLDREIKASAKFYRRNRDCFFCELVEKDIEGPRLILADKEYVAITPWASINPLEFWIVPREHKLSLLDVSGPSLESFAETLKRTLTGLKELANDPPYNFGFHMSIDAKNSDYYHWHLEVYPKLAVWAGFEKSTGVYINTVAPEDAADSLRKAVSASLRE